jgi:hypothetical protein
MTARSRELRFSVPLWKRLVKVAAFCVVLVISGVKTVAEPMAPVYLTFNNTQRIRCQELSKVVWKGEGTFKHYGPGGEPIMDATLGLN